MTSIVKPCRRMGLAAALLVLSLSRAAATGDINCEATDGSGASINVGVGHMPILAVLSAQAFDGTQSWSTHESGDEVAIRFGQGISDERQLLIDFTDASVLRIVVSVRLFRATIGRSAALSGILVFADGPVVPVHCTSN